MNDTEALRSKEVVQPQHYSALFLLPAYPYPQNRVSGAEGMTERLIWRNKKAPAKWGLAPDTQLRVIATALVSRRDFVDRVVCMSGAIRTWMTDTYANLMEKQLRRLEPSMTIIKEHVSVDLQSELDAIAALAKQEEKGWRISPQNPIGIVVDSEQQERVRMDIEVAKMKIGFFPDYKIIPADQILQQERYLSKLKFPFEKKILQSVVENYVNSPYWTKFWKMREWVSRIGGKYISKISEATRRK